MARRSQSAPTTSLMYIITIPEFHVVVFSSLDAQLSYQNDSLEGQTHSEATLGVRSSVVGVSQPKSVISGKSPMRKWPQDLSGLLHIQASIEQGAS